MTKTLIDVKELSNRLGGIAMGSIYNWVSQARHGRGPFASGTMIKKIGRCLRFDWDEIEEKLLRGKIGIDASKG